MGPIQYQTIPYDKSYSGSVTRPSASTIPPPTSSGNGAQVRKVRFHLPDAIHKQTDNRVDLVPHPNPPAGGVER